MSLPRNVQLALEHPNFLLLAQLGQIPGVRVIPYQGHCAALPSGQSRAVWLNADNASMAFAGNTALYAVSSSANDAAAGTGAQVLYVEGIKADGSVVSETVTLNGQTNVNLTETYAFVNVMDVVRAGSGGAPAGRISLKNQSGDTVRHEIHGGTSNINQLAYACPAGRVAFLLSLTVGWASTGTTAASRIHIFRRGPDEGDDSGLILYRPRTFVVVPAGVGHLNREFGFEHMIPANAMMEVNFLNGSGQNMFLGGEMTILEIEL